MDSDSAAVLDAIRRLVRLLRLSTRHSQGKSGVSSAQLFVLQRLGESNAASIAELSRRLLADPSSVSVVVARLVSRGLVSRGRSALDARRATLAVTAKGRKLLRTAPEPAQARLVSALRRLPASRRRALASALGGLIRELGLQEGPAPLFFEQES